MGLLRLFAVNCCAWQGCGAGGKLNKCPLPFIQILRPLTPPPKLLCPKIFSENFDLKKYTLLYPKLLLNSLHGRY